MVTWRIGAYYHAYRGHLEDLEDIIEDEMYDIRGRIMSVIREESAQLEFNEARLLDI